MKTEEDVKLKIKAIKFLLEVERTKPDLERDLKIIKHFKEGVNWLEWLFEEDDEE